MKYHGNGRDADSELHIMAHYLKKAFWGALAFICLVLFLFWRITDPKVKPDPYRYVTECFVDGKRGFSVLEGEDIYSNIGRIQRPCRPCSEAKRDDERKVCGD